MKKLLLLAAAFAVTFAAVAQKPVVKTQDYKSVVATANMNQDLRGDNVPALPVKVSKGMTAPAYDQEMEVMHTYYDLQSNSALSSRFYRFSSPREKSGHIGATCTGGIQNPSASGFPDRGSFYNYFNGTEWVINPADVTRIEEQRRGWPSYTGDANGGEWLASHSAGIDLYHREVAGEGDWRQVAYPVSSAENTWPRICINPETGTIHLIECEQRAVGEQNENYIYYSRSTDGGKTWDPQGEQFAQIEGHYSTIAYSADDYIWATPRAGVIAFALLSPTADAIIMKSTDDGNTWEKITVCVHPVPMFDYYTMTMDDTCFAPTGAGGLAIDDNGMCHIMFGACAVLFAETGGSYTYFPKWGGMRYWNEDMDTYSGYDGLRMSEDFETFLAELKCEMPMAYGFCFDGDADAVHSGDIDVCAYYRTFGPAKFVDIEMAGPNRLLCAVSSWDERRDSPKGFVMTQIYLTSYIFSDEDDRWEQDTTWVIDRNMAGYICGWTAGGEAIETDWAGWFRMNSSYLHEYDECIYPQILTQYSDNESANFYVFYQMDEACGLAMDTEAGDQTEFTDNTIMMYYNDRQFNGGNIPEIYLGINDPVEEEVASMTVYPNPASDMITIELKDASNVRVYNVLGQVMDSFKVNGRHTLNVASYKPGVYFVSTENGLTQKFIVK
ncbi:MAG: T9SS type A sorting domain-containing protein [Bacteroidales bacterium]|nr:T9SS type A sorting domain-containing protein [Bacteroidales bacterium]